MFSTHDIEVDAFAVIVDVVVVFAVLVVLESIVCFFVVAVVVVVVDVVVSVSEVVVAFVVAISVGLCAKVFGRADGFGGFGDVICVV